MSGGRRKLQQMVWNTTHHQTLEPERRCVCVCKSEAQKNPGARLVNAMPQCC